MAPINSKDLSVLKDMCGSHSNFTTLQLARINELAREMKMILEDSKKREQEAIARTGARNLSQVYRMWSECESGGAPNVARNNGYK